MDVGALDRTRIAAKINRALRTVDRAYAGIKIADTSRAAITLGARELGLPPPPPAKPKPRGRAV